MDRFIDLYSLMGEGWEEWWKTTVGSAQGQHEGVCNWEVGGRGERVVLQGYDWLLFNFCFVIILF